MLPFLKKKILADVCLAWLHAIDLSWLYLTRDNSQMGYYNLLFSLAIAAKPSLILELGTGPGLSSLAFARALQYYRARDGQNGILHTCDIDPKPIAELNRHIKFGNLIVPHIMSTDELSVKWKESATPIDFLYIDAYHSHEQSLADFEHFWPYIVPNGLVLMHDTFPLSPNHEDLKYSGTVWKTAQHIKKFYSSECELVTFPYLCGIGILRKKGAKYF
jgi:predicted O-methyltransferase YrrM